MKGCIMPANQVRTPPHQQIFSFLLLPILCGLSLLLSFSAVPARTLPHQIGAFSAQGHWTDWAGNAAPTFDSCEAQIHIPCYTPQLFRQAYDLTSLINKGFTGKGQTIVIIDSFGSPTALSDLQQFDAAYGLPDPPSFQQLAPIGSVPFDPTNADQRGWAEETSLDVQWSHAMAPDANIVVLTSPVSETQGVQGMPEFLQLEQFALDHHLGKIISQSWGTTENTLFTPDGQKVLNGFESFYQRAALSGMSVFASAGDAGTGNPDVNGNIFPFPTVGFPASSPWLTAVGGTSLFTDSNGNYQNETVWNDGVGSATGGGISQTFHKPFYQAFLPKNDQQLLNDHRGLPDISMNADPRTPVPVFLGFLGNRNGFHLFGGTSEGAPVWAGLTAVANQFVGHPVGFLNPVIYALGFNKHVASTVFHDITVGNNAQAPIPGFSATPGWDAATGWGTPIIQPLFQALKFGFI
jgi:subtilase family serine protease